LLPSTRKWGAVLPGAVDADPYPWPSGGDLALARTALLCLDWQASAFRPGALSNGGGVDDWAQRALERATEVLNGARRAGLAVAHTREGHQPDLSDCPPSKLWRSRRAENAATLLVKGGPGWEIVAPMAPRAGEWVIDKPGKGAFYATPLDLVLRSHGITHLVLTGLTTDVVLSSTIREAADRGYDCLVLSDCTASPDHANYLAALEMITMQSGLFGAVATSGALVSALGL